MTKTFLLALLLALAGVASTGVDASYARSTNGCDTNDNEGSDHGNGHDAWCDSQGFE